MIEIPKAWVIIARVKYFNASYVYADDGQNKTEKAFSPNVYHVGAFSPIGCSINDKSFRFTDNRLMTALHMSKNLLLKS